MSFKLNIEFEWIVWVKIEIQLLNPTKRVDIEWDSVA